MKEAKNIAEQARDGVFKLDKNKLTAGTFI